MRKIKDYIVNNSNTISVKCVCKCICNYFIIFGSTFLNAIYFCNLVKNFIITVDYYIFLGVTRTSA